ncbi:MAG: response regulator [Planctomycetota bacterium]|jgi:CheY-like chemotaxis protein
MAKSIGSMNENELRNEYKKLYGAKDDAHIMLLKSVIDEFAKRKVPLPGSDRDLAGGGGKKKKTVYIPKKVEKGFLGKVIIAEDDKRISTLVATQMRTLRLEPLEFSNGTLALKCAERELPNLLILDNKMPGSTGITVCSRVRALPGGAEIPIMLVTGHGDKKTVMGAVMSGITEIVSKPFEVKDLVERVKRLIKYDELLEKEKEGMKKKEAEKSKK